jgi:hypothetical protein
MSSALGPRIGVWGAFDVADYGNLLVPRIFENELRRRLPYARVFPYAPLGAEHPIAIDGGRPAAPLGDWTRARPAQLAEQFDLVAVAGSEELHQGDDLDREPSRFLVDGLGEELEQRCPVVFWVQSDVCRERLLAAGTERRIDVVPDLAILASRLLSDETARKRLGYLRAVNRYPADKPPLVLESSTRLGLGADAYTRAVSEARAHDPALPIVLVALGSAESDSELARALAAGIDGAAHELTADVTLDDLVVAIGNARAFCGASSAGFSTALAFGVPAVRDAAEVGALLRGEIAADPQVIRELIERVDAYFDKLAALAEESWSEHIAPASAAELARELGEAERRHEALLRAYVERGERLLVEKQRVAEMLDALEADQGQGAEGAVRLGIELAEARNRIEVLDAALAEARFERDKAQ